MFEPSPALHDAGWRAVTRTEQIGAIHRSNGFPRRLVVTFDALSEFNHRRSRVSGDRVAKDCEADHLHIGTNLGNWFQSPDIFDVIRGTRALRDNYEEAILYGHSMGAYGALLLSGPLAATNVVAFAPQFSIDPVKAPFENRFQAFASNITFIFDEMTKSMSRVAPKYVVFDPFALIDREHFNSLFQLGGVQPVRIPFVGHNPGQMLREGGVLRQFASALLLQKLSASGRRQAVRVARRRSHRYFVERAVHVSRRGHFKEALSLINIAYVLEPQNFSVLETFQALLQSDARYYGLAHVMVRLLLKEHSSLSYYENTLAQLWCELESNARRVIDAPMSTPFRFDDLRKPTQPLSALSK